MGPAASLLRPSHAVRVSCGRLPFNGFMAAQSRMANGPCSSTSYSISVHAPYSRTAIAATKRGHYAHALIAIYPNYEKAPIHFSMGYVNDAHFQASAFCRCKEKNGRVFLGAASNTAVFRPWEPN